MIPVLLNFDHTKTIGSACFEDDGQLKIKFSKDVDMKRMLDLIKANGLASGVGILDEDDVEIKCFSIDTTKI